MAKAIKRNRQRPDGEEKFWRFFFVFQFSSEAIPAVDDDVREQDEEGEKADNTRAHEHINYELLENISKWNSSATEFPAIRTRRFVKD